MKFQQNNTGSEGILDVILSLTLIFMLMSSLANDTPNTSHQEFNLPSIDLSKNKVKKTQDGRDFEYTLSLNKKDGEVEYFFNKERVNEQALDSYLKDNNVFRLAIRRDKNLTCGEEDAVIANLQNSGVVEIAFMIKGE